MLSLAKNNNFYVWGKGAQCKGWKQGDAYRPGGLGVGASQVRQFNANMGLDRLAALSMQAIITQVSLFMP